MGILVYGYGYVYETFGFGTLKDEGVEDFLIGHSLGPPPLRSHMVKITQTAK